jgi:hypothetical protein
VPHPTYTAISVDICKSSCGSMMGDRAILHHRAVSIEVLANLPGERRVLYMDTINISFDQLYREDMDPAELAAQIQALRDAGFRVNLQLNHREALNTLQHIPVMLQQQETRRLTMPRLLGLALLASLGSIFFGLIRF